MRENDGYTGEDEEYICPNCGRSVYDDEALLCLYCGENLRRGVGFIGKLKYSWRGAVIFIAAMFVLIGFAMLVMR